ncbi:hypothetical protein DMA11_19275 [Marinilabiliaceae bacterium JC017]|nr:hypothetical protein DMA11_19275 [Marinilabiliaceae bacterium JC017]
MRKKHIIPALFIVAALIQLAIPAQMVWNHEDILESGRVYRFKTAPIDPSDPFRGKYITLSFEADGWITVPTHDWDNGDAVFVQLTNDSAGFAQIAGISKDQPNTTNNYFETKIQYTNYENDTTQVFIEFPFDRYYMTETKAYTAETAVRKATADSTQVTYALVSIKDGTAVLKDVMVNDTPIKTWVEQIMREENQSKDLP